MSDSALSELGNIDVGEQMTLEALSNSQLGELIDDLKDDIFDDILRAVDTENTSPTCNVRLNKTSNVPFPVINFNHCTNVTVNYNTVHR